MGYKCVKSDKDCDCCKKCVRPDECESCGTLDDSLIETEVGWLCYSCFIKYTEEEM